MRRPIQGYGGSPGLLVLAERLADKGLEVLGEAPGGELIESSPSQCLRATLSPTPRIDLQRSHDTTGQTGRRQ
jgi:hypothetical protein